MWKRINKSDRLRLKRIKDSLPYLRKLKTQAEKEKRQKEHRAIMTEIVDKELGMTYEQALKADAINKSKSEG